jgi:multidrug efflux pump subunit AcrB
MWIVRAALKNPHAVCVLALLIGVLGGLAVIYIPKDILPVFKAPAVQVMTYYAGMPTPAVEKTITNRIERWTNQAAGCRLVESKSTLGVSVVRLYFRDDIDPNGALTQVNSLALSTLPTLPPNTLPPVVLPFDPTGTMPLGMLSVEGQGMGETELKDLARIDVRNMLGGVKGVVAPATFGGKDRTILIYVDPKKLQARNLSPLDVVEALQRENMMTTPGVAKMGPYEFQLDSNAMVKAVDELNNIPIRFDPGNRVYLSDVGHAEDSHAIQTALVHIDGRRQVYVPIYRQQGASSLAVTAGVNDAIPQMEKNLHDAGHDIDLKLVMDQSVYVQKAIESLLHEGLIGAVLVSIMILIFLGNWKMTVVASLSIPLAVLCSIIGLFATGNTINAMTLGGLALAVGPLVDDAIVVLENTHRHHTLGKSRFKAAFDGAVEVTLPVLVATLTTIIVLCPIGLMPGMGGFLFRPLALAVAFAMLSSFVLSRTLVPVMCGYWVGKGHELHHVGHGNTPVPRGPFAVFGAIHRRIDHAFTVLTRLYERLLTAALKHRTAVLGIVGVLFVASLGLLFGIGQEFFPQVDAGQLSISVRCPSGTNIEETERRVSAVEEFLMREDVIPHADREKIISELGLVPDWSAAYTQNSGSQDAIVKVQLTPERGKTAQQYAIDLRRRLAEEKAFDDLRFSFDTGGMVSAALNYGASSPIDVQIAAPGSTDAAFDLAREVREKVAAIPGAVDVRVKQRLDAPQRFLDVDRQKAADAGLDVYQVMNQAATALNSSVAVRRNFWIDPKSGNQYFVGVQYREDAAMKLDTLLDIPATGGNEEHPVKLSSLVTVKYASAPVEANHLALARIFDVLVNTQNRDVGGLARDIQAKLGDLHEELERRVGDLKGRLEALRGRDDAAAKSEAAVLEKEVKFAEDQAALAPVLRGEYEQMQNAFGSLGFGLAMAALLVYLLLVVLFRSFLGPFIIMFAVPLGLIGVLTMLFLTHTTLNVQSSMGVIFMVGIVVSNSVLLVDFANKQRKAGMSVRAAIRSAAAIRFRPILMTFLATFLDLAPMATGLIRGDEMNVPLARAVVGGLLTSTFLTLIVVPVLYTLLVRDGGPAETNIDAELAA